jgi:hypothetical protein
MCDSKRAIALLYRVDVLLDTVCRALKLAGDDRAVEELLRVREELGAQRDEAAALVHEAVERERQRSLRDVAT